MTFWQFMGYTLWVFLLMTFISVLIWVLVDMFRRPDLSGVAKAAWLLLIIILPIIGALAYMIFRPPIESVPAPYSPAYAPAGGSTSQAEQLRILSDLRDQGKLTDSEYESAKSRVIAPPAAGPAPRPTPT